MRIGRLDAGWRNATMAPKNKFTKEEMTEAALRVVRQQGLDGLTAKTLLYIVMKPLKLNFGMLAI